ncbi:MAG: methionine biosynthesis protein MetW [Micropruina sp.]|nr:methionine biosynthesis protein MetW [Micropruina sp.]
MTLRPDLALVAELIPTGSRVLDLGCGGGALLHHLAEESGCSGIGVEIDPDAVLEALRVGVSVIELDIDRQLDAFAPRSFDVVVLSRTLQTIRRPEEVLQEMSRIGDLLIVSVPNFGWWGHRLRLLTGRMPMSKELPYAWYNTPNLRFTTLADLEDLFASLDLTVQRRITLTVKGAPLTVIDRAANLMAGAAVYVLSPSR